MSKKILFIYSNKTQIELPQKLFTEYQVRTAVKNKYTVDTILQFKPQVLIFDEFVDTKYVSFILNRFKFIPICVIGYFENIKKLEEFLQLGVTVINLSQQQELEIISAIENLLWFSLSREELWDEEYKLSKNEFLLSKIKFFLGFFLLAVIISSLFYFTPKLYSMLIKPKPIFYEVDFKYLSPSDVASLGDVYIINDWTVKNLFEYNEKDELLKMYVPEQQFNAISINNLGYVAAASMYSSKVYLYKYPNFSVTVATVPFNNVVMALNFDKDNHLYILDNKRTLYEYIITENFQELVLISSFVISEFFPIDIYVEDKSIYFLDNENNIYKFDKEQKKIVTRIILNKFFDINQIKFTSFLIDKNYLFLISEKSKKGFKLPKNILT